MVGLNERARDGSKSIQIQGLDKGSEILYIFIEKYIG